jgi:hypothetical protein
MFVILGFNMAYEERDTCGIYKENADKGPGPELMGVNSLIGYKVHNRQDEHLDDIKEIILGMRSGKIADAVHSFGGVVAVGDKLFAVPWNALKLDTANKRFVFGIEKDGLKKSLNLTPVPRQTGRPVMGL